MSDNDKVHIGYNIYVTEWHFCKILGYSIKCTSANVFSISLFKILHILIAICFHYRKMAIVLCGKAILTFKTYFNDI